KTSIFSHPVYLFLREFSLQDFRGGSIWLIKRMPEAEPDQQMRTGVIAAQPAKCSYHCGECG
ncbi:hypothetical protein C9Y86_26415, partial (plasmid) [Escherichia coli]